MSGVHRELFIAVKDAILAFGVLHLYFSFCNGDDDVAFVVGIDVKGSAQHRSADGARMDDKGAGVLMDVEIRLAVEGYFTGCGGKTGSIIELCGFVQQDLAAIGQSNTAVGRLGLRGYG